MRSGIRATDAAAKIYRFSISLLAHFAPISRASSADSTEAGGNSSRQLHPTHPSGFSLPPAELQSYGRSPHRARFQAEIRSSERDLLSNIRHDASDSQQS